MKRLAILAAMATGMAGCASVPMPAPRGGFQLAYLGRDAIFVETATLVRQGSVASFRTLRVQDSQFQAGEAAFVGGYGRSQIDCAARTFQLLSFQSLKPGLVPGPEQPVRGGPEPIAAGSAEAAMAAAVCDGKPAYRVRARTAEKAVEVGRRRLDRL